MAIFTSETAREAALRSHEPTSARYAKPVDAAREAELSEEFRLERLARVRGQLRRLDLLMATEADPQKLDRIAAAQGRLAEQERVMSGRPMPGSLKPTSAKSRSRSAPEPEPSPASASQEQPPLTPTLTSVTEPISPVPNPDTPKP